MRPFRRTRESPIDRETIRRLYAYVAFRIGDGPDAEDVVGDTIERALRYGRSYDPTKGDRVAWLVGIARRRIATHYSRPVDLVPLKSSDGAPITGEMEHEVVERLALNAAVARLEHRDRELVSLHYGADLSPRQIAELLELRTNAVEVALHRARNRLRALLEGEDAGGDRAASREDAV
jgi:RNA polymerase sigma-70 factor (ECF subfamily)